MMASNPLGGRRGRWQWALLMGCSVSLGLGSGAPIGAIAQTLPTAPLRISRGNANLATTVLRPTLRVGSQGEAVRELQATLKLLGFYDGDVDGIFGESTFDAVSRFQTAAQIEADGVAGPATWARLFPTVAATTDTPEPTTPASGGDPGAVDGFPTPSPSPAPSPQPAPTAQPEPSPTPAPQPEPQAKPQPEPTVAKAAEPDYSNVALPILRRGMRGPAIVGLQERLRALGVFSGAVDGIFGPATQAAVETAQRKFQLDPDGIVGPATWRALLQN